MSDCTFTLEFECGEGLFVGSRLVDHGNAGDVGLVVGWPANGRDAAVPAVVGGLLLAGLILELLL